MLNNREQEYNVLQVGLELIFLGIFLLLRFLLQQELIISTTSTHIHTGVKGPLQGL